MSGAVTSRPVAEEADGTAVSSVVLSVAVQHHPSRAPLLQVLLDELGEPVDVVADPAPELGPNPWRCYREALERTPETCTHRLVIQDDAIPCARFLEAARLAASARPHRLLVFFVGGAPVTYKRAIFDACARGDSWAVLRAGTWCPAVCVLWPVPMIAPFLEYANAHVPVRMGADDEIIGRYLSWSGAAALASVPSLVEHPDVVLSTIGRRAAAGRNPNRVAACFIDDDCDATGIDWTLGPG